MNKLTDLEICKRIAEIEGVSLYDKPNDMTGNLETVYPPYMSYNPLTDDALCFKFCCEDGITVQKSMSVINGKMEWNGKYYATHPRNKDFGSVDENPNKAVCLEKIEAHNER